MPIKKENNIKYYTPNRALVEYLQKKLQIERNEEKLKNVGVKLSEKEETEKTNNDRMKIHVLDKIVFQSMANITYFLQYIVNNRELQYVFNDDLQDLFGLQRIKDKNSLGFMFEMLLRGALEWDNGIQNKYAYTAIFYGIIAEIISRDLQPKILEHYKDFDLQGLFVQDSLRMKHWLHSYSRGRENDYDLELTRRTFEIHP